MNCKNVLRSLSAFVDQELPGEQMAQVRMHIASCRDCQAECDRLVSVKRSLMTLAPVEPSEVPSIREVSRPARVRTLSYAVVAASVLAVAFAVSNQGGPIEPEAEDYVADGRVEEPAIEAPYDPFGNHVEFVTASFEGQ